MTTLNGILTGIKYKEMQIEDQAQARKKRG